MVNDLVDIKNMFGVRGTHPQMDGHNLGLARGQPEGPLARKALGQDGNHALDRAQDGAVDDHRAVLRVEHFEELPWHVGASEWVNSQLTVNTTHLLALLALGWGVLQAEAQRQLEVQLDGGTLVCAVQGVQDGDVNLPGQDLSGFCAE